MPASGICHKSEKRAQPSLTKMKFEKHVYGRTRKHELRSITDFDPRPFEFQGTVKDSLPKYFDKVRGHNLGISVMLDSTMQVWPDTGDENTTTSLSTKELIKRASSFY